MYATLFRLKIFRISSNKLFFKFHFNNLDYFVYVHYMESTFKFQVVMQQNRKNAKGYEYFCKALYIYIATNIYCQIRNVVILPQTAVVVKKLTYSIFCI